MTGKEEIRQKWPHLYPFLVALWLDNIGFPLDSWKPNFETEVFVDKTAGRTITFDNLDAEAARILNGHEWDGEYIDVDNDWILFVYGEMHEVDQVVIKHNAQELSRFLTECFDGELSTQFHGDL